MSIGSLRCPIRAGTTVALSEYLHTQLPAHRRARLRDTLNSNDGIAL